VLFSKDRVAEFVNRHFEPAWESTRPVPVVRIDFGDGNVVTRTLHGNILTSVCTPDGLLLDALPGIYTEDGYLSALNRLRLVAGAARTRPAEQRDEWARGYHRGEAKKLQEQEATARVAKVTAGVAIHITKGAIERPVEAVVGRPSGPNVTPNGGQPVRAAKPARPDGDVSGWEELAQDTRLNETTRRLQIHQMLAGVGLARPAKSLRPIYKDVLHADLDDPYLGLGAMLFDKYPFAREDRRQ
jgi:hypothetical protein